MATESWVFEDPNWVRRGYGATFAVRECGACLWEIYGSPFLLDLEKRFNSLEEAQKYCDERWSALFGHREEITILRGQVEALDNERNWLWTEKLQMQLEITRLNEMVQKAYYEGWQDSVNREYSRQEIQKDWETSAAAAAIREGGKGD